MYASTPTKLSLHRFAEIMGINPIHMAGGSFSGLTETAGCAAVWFQWPWQFAGRASREELATAIARAEDRIESYLGYRLVPSFERDEIVRMPQPYNAQSVYVNNFGITGRPRMFRTKWGRVISGGIRGKTLIQAGMEVTRTDVDGDGFKETATLANVATDVNVCELRLYYPGQSGDDRFLMRPVKAVRTASTVTFTFDSVLLMKGQLTRTVKMAETTAINAAEDGNFETTVDLYREYIDPSEQIEFRWIPVGGCYTCGGSGCPNCGYATQTGCILPHEPALGWCGYSFGEWDADTSAYSVLGSSLGYQPDLAVVSYYAGATYEAANCPRQTLDPEMERAIAQFAMGYVDRPLCTCAQDGTRRWKDDLAYDSKGNASTRFKTTVDDLSNPFGTWRGAVDAWRLVSRLRDRNVPSVYPY